MSHERPHRIEEVFQHALALSGEARARYVEQECGADGALLAEVERMVVAASLQEGETTQTIGSYRVVRHIASGSMGAVYEAEQEHPRRRVAIKVLNSALVGEELRRRFEREAEILGDLQHPGIAQILEAGTYRSDGGVELPFMAMELINGKTILDYVREHDLGVRERAILFSRVCEAVEYAHERGVVHRDLKPANILVDEMGQPKVLDFGVAHITGSDLTVATLVTQPGVLLGTLAYMSPEQARGDVEAVDARADVHALGVLLFELLSGRLPYDVRGCPLPEAVRLLNEDDPTTLGSINPSLTGDLQTIVHRAIEKEPGRRYASAADLASDLGRYLRNEPIHARPPSRIYRLRKFTRRHRSLAVASTLIAITLSAATVASAVAAVEARKQTRIADRALTETQRGMEELYEMLSIWRASQPVGTYFPQHLKLRQLEIEIMERAAPGFRRAWDAISAEMTITRLGNVAMFRQWGELLMGLDADLPPTARHCAAGLLMAMTRRIRLYSEEDDSYRRFLQRAEEWLREDVSRTDPRLLLARTRLVDSLNLEQRHGEARRVVTGWLHELVNAGYGPDSPPVALYTSRKGTSLVGLGRYREADPMLSATEAIVERRWGARLAFDVKAARLAVAESLEETEKARTLRDQLMHHAAKEDAPGPLWARIALGPRLAPLWSAVRALEVSCDRPGTDVMEEFNEFLELKAQLGVRDDSPEAAILAIYVRFACNWHGTSHGWNHDTTLFLYQEVLRMLRAGPVQSKQAVTLALVSLSFAHLCREEHEMAERISREGLEVRGPREDELAWGLRTVLGASLGQMGRFKEGHEQLLTSYRGLLEVYGPDHKLTYTAFLWLKNLHLLWGSGEEAARCRAEVEDALHESALDGWRSQMELLPMIEQVLAGEPLESTPIERMRVATALYLAFCFEESCEQFARALEEHPELPIDQAECRYFAACSAARAPGDAWHSQGIAWLRAGLDVFRTRVAAEPALVQERLRLWKREPNLAALRDRDDLPPEFTKLWSDVDALLEQASR